MAPERIDRIDRLADALTDVGRRIDLISTELRAMRPSAATAVPPAPEPDRLPGSVPAQADAPGPVPAQADSPGAGTAGASGQWPAYPATATGGAPPGGFGPPPSPPRRPGWEREGFGSRLLAWAGAAVTLAGVVLLLVLAVQRGYLGPLPRVLLGAALGLALVGTGVWLHRTPAGRTGAFAVAATGFAVLYLDVVAATGLYGFLPAAGGLAAGLLVAAGGVLLAGRWSAQGLAVFVVLACAVSAPVLTGGFVPLLLGFLLVLQLGATPVQLARRWSALCGATAVPPVLATGLAVLTAQVADTDGALVAYLGLVTSVAQVLVAVAVARRSGDATATGLVLLAPVPAMLGAIVVPPLASVVLPGTVGALLVLVWVTGLRRPGQFTTAAGGAGAVAVLQATVSAVDGPVTAAVLLAQGLLLAMVARGLRYPAALGAAGLFAVVGLFHAVTGPVPVALLAAAPDGPVPAGTAAVAGLTGLLLAVTFAALALGTSRPASAGFGVVALYGAAAAVLAVGLLVAPDRGGFLLGHVLVTVSWTVGALALLVRGISSVAARTAGLSLVGAALVKLVLFDLSSLDGLARVAAFLVAGLVLLAAGARYARLLATRPPGNA